MTKLYICIKTERIKTIVEQVCKDIFIKDKTFKYTIFKNKSFRGREQDCRFILSIDCPDNDTAHKKGTWFAKKVAIGWGCKNCRWQGKLEDLVSGYRGIGDGSGDVEGYSECPKCGSDDVEELNLYYWVK